MKAPDWAIRPFESCVDELERLERLVSISARGIASLRGMPRVVDVLAKADGVDPKSEEHRTKLENAQEVADLARLELSSDFPFLHRMSTVALWSILEGAVLGFVAEWLAHKPESLQSDAVAKLRFRVGDLHMLESEERFSVIASLLDRETSAGLRKGVERFESLLRPFELTGPIPDQLARDLFELGQIRNAAVHAGGRVDRDLARSCPWLELQVGHELHVSQRMFHRYAGAASTYVAILICRVAAQWGTYLDSDYQKILDGYNREPPSEIGSAV